MADFPLSTALRKGLRGYSSQTLRHDLIAGLVVSLVALPLSMALSIAVGLPPQHGLYTAIVAGIVCALFGGSMTQVSGPTAAFVVIVAPIVAQYGLHGIIWCQILAGLMLLALGFARLGRLINFVPYPVTTGFTAGIAVTIATLALNDFFGLGIEKLQGPYVEKAKTIFNHLPDMQWPSLAVGMLAFVLIWLMPRLTAKIPSTLFGIGAATALAWYLNHHGYNVDTLASRFSFTLADGTTGQGIPPFAPQLHLPGRDALLAWPTYAEFKTLLMPAFVIAALAALESLLSATVADSMARTRHDPNAELSGIGLANIASGLVAGIPATGAIARTATNIHAGAKTPLSSIFHALLILVYVIAFAPYISHIPMAALAALLLMTAWRMSHAGQFLNIIRLAPRSDMIVLLICFLLTVFIDMVAGVTVGMILASLLFMKRVSDITHFNIETTQKKQAPDVPHDVMVYHINGPLFFGSVDKALAQADFINTDIKRLVIDLSDVPIIDMTGMVGMKTFLMSVVHGGRDTVVCGKKDVVDKIMQKIAPLPIAKFVRSTYDLKTALEGDAP